MDYADLTADGDEGMRGRYPIRNAIFNWSSDSDPKKFGKKNTGMFKRLVSGEPVPMRKLGRDILEGNSIPYLIFSLNESPNTEDVSLGFVRRLQYIDFDVTIPKERQDPELASKIISGELSGVFNWIFRGAMELKKRNYRFPNTSGGFRNTIISLLDKHPIGAWIMAYSMRGKPEAKNEISSWMSSKDLYERFVEFCRLNDIDEGTIPTIQKFGRDMWNQYGFFKKRFIEGNKYQVYGALMDDLKEKVLINDIKSPRSEEESRQPESFIKPDD